MPQLTDPVFVPLAKIYWFLATMETRGCFYLTINEVGDLSLEAVWYTGFRPTEYITITFED